jgi:chemotaxis protein methyltransferase CheR
MVMAKKVPMNKIHIYATDIDEQVLAKAKDGVYGANSLNGLPDEYKKKYFEKMGDRYYKISDDIKRMTLQASRNFLMFYEKDWLPVLLHCRSVLRERIS